MTLLAELFDRLDSIPLVIGQPQASALAGAVEHTAPKDTAELPPAPAPIPAAGLTAEVASEPQRIVRTAATATPEWRAARDQYLSHVMTCCACHAPTSRHCPVGAELRATYDTTPMELTR